MPKTHWPARKKIMIGAAIAAGLLILLLTTSHRSNEPSPKHLSLPHYIKEKIEAHQIAALPWQTITVQPGDTLSDIFNHLDIQAADLRHLLASPSHPLSVLRPGEKLTFRINQDHELIAIKAPLDASSTLLLERDGNSFKATTLQKPTTVTLAFKSATIHHSLASTASKAGLSANLLMQLQNIFSGNINFNRNIQEGDHFALLYEVYYIDGKPFRVGHIVAASFTNRGKTFHAVRFTYPKNHSGYYTADGHNIEHRFLSTPVKYKRVSSPFSYSRLDPVTHRVHSHLGVDLAAPSGTPIKSIGDGVVIFKGPDAGYGNAVKIRYGTHYRTLYAHLSRFAKDLKVHQHVHRGQIIGYVGATGWATGPHLHFGIFLDGVAKDWLKLKPPKGEPIPRSYKTRFEKKAKELLDELALHEKTLKTDIENAK